MSHPLPTLDETNLDVWSGYFPPLRLTGEVPLTLLEDRHRSDPTASATVAPCVTSYGCSRAAFSRTSAEKRAPAKRDNREAPTDPHPSSPNGSCPTIRRPCR